MATQSKGFSAYEDDLDLEHIDFEHIYELHRDYKLKYNLWKALSDFET